MRYRILDENGDYSFGRNQQSITWGAFAVAQAIKTRLSLLKSEWWENQELGFPLFQNIIGKFTSQVSVDWVDSYIKSYILDTPNVTSIKDFNSTFENRTYSFTATVTTPSGNVTVAKTF